MMIHHFKILDAIGLTGLQVDRCREQHRLFRTERRPKTNNQIDTSSFVIGMMMSLCGGLLPYTCPQALTNAGVLTRVYLGRSVLGLGAFAVGYSVHVSID